MFKNIINKINKIFKMEEDFYYRDDQIKKLVYETRKEEEYFIRDVLNNYDDEYDFIPNRFKPKLLDLGNEFVWEIDKSILYGEYIFSSVELRYFDIVMDALDIHYDSLDITTLEDRYKKYKVSLVYDKELMRYLMKNRFMPSFTFKNNLVENFYKEKLKEKINNLKDETRTFKRNKNGELTSIKI